VETWADDSELWFKLGEVCKALGLFPKAAEAYGRVKNTGVRGSAAR
jgi:prophage antirepressor-like protein